MWPSTTAHGSIMATDKGTKGSGDIIEHCRGGKQGASYVVASIRWWGQLKKGSPSIEQD